MKKFVIFLLMFVTLPCFAETTQTIKNNQGYFTANLQKQPEQDNKQKIQNHFTFFTINIQINGKIKDTVDNFIK